METAVADWPLLPDSQVRLINSMVGVRRVLRIDAPAKGEIRFGGKRSNHSFPWTIGLASKDGTCQLKLDSLPNLGLFDRSFEGVSLEEIGAEFQLVALNAAVEQWRNSIATLVYPDWQFTSIAQDDEKADPSLFPLCLEVVADGAAPLFGQIWLDEIKVGYLADLLDQLPYEQCRLPEQLPISIQLVIGFLELSKEDIDCVECGDLLLLPGSHSTLFDRCLIFSGERFLRAASIRENQASICVMSNPSTQPSDEPTGVPISELNEINVRLRFELGEQTITLGELARLRTGYVFELARGITEPIEIRCNGQLVGEGEIVNVEGRAGVVITRWMSGVEPPRQR
jgi:type III secretion system YscQ/HrcQ family protein